MAFQSLYRRYRPRRFAEVKGQEHVVRALRNAVREGTVAHAYLFSGPRGTGKTSTARLLAKALNCEAPVDGEPCAECPPCLAIEAGTSLDVSELDAASNNGVENMRDLIRRVSLAGAGRHRVYILDEVHMLSAGAENALLKTLEEPPPNVTFVLATTDPQKVAPTIRSRTQHFDFRLLPAATLAEHVRWVVADAGLDVGESAVESAVRRGGGSARDTLSALDQIVAAGGEADDDTFVDEMVEALCDRDTGRALVAVSGACAAGRDARDLADALLGHLRDAFLSVLAPDAVSLPDAALERVSDQGRRLGPAAAVRALDAVGDALLAMREAPAPRVALEVALVRVTRPEADTSPAALLERIERLERALRGGAPDSPSEPASGETVPVSAGSPPPDPAPGPAGAARAAAHQAVAEPSEEVRPPAGGAPASAAREALAKAGSRPALGAVRKQVARPAAPPPPPGAPSRAEPQSGPSATSSGPPSARPSASPAPSAPPAESPAVGASESPAAGASALPTRDEVTLAWADHVSATLKPKARGMFNSGRFVTAGADAVVFAVSTDIMRDKCEECRADVEAAFAAHFGRPVPLRVVVDVEEPAERPGEPPVEEPVDLDDLTDAPADPRTGVDRLTEAFPGAEIISE